MDKTSPKVSAIILAGGKSRRMGRDKAFLEFDGKMLIERVIERVRSMSDDIIIVCNDVEAYAKFGERMVTDVIPGKGSLGGLYSGLLAVKQEYALAVACDMPFLNESLLRHLISLAPGFDVVIPHAHDLSSVTPRSSQTVNPRQGTVQPSANQPLAKEKDLHPMHAVYSRNCLPAIEKHMQTDDLRLIGFLREVRTYIVEADQVNRFDPRHLSFFNANTPEDYELARSLRDSQSVTE